MLELRDIDIARSEGYNIRCSNCLGQILRDEESKHYCRFRSKYGKIIPFISEEQSDHYFELSQEEYEKGCKLWHPNDLRSEDLRLYKIFHLTKEPIELSNKIDLQEEID